jgi:iron complex outermembrane recepter protein
LNDKPQLIEITGPTDTPYDSTNFSPIGRFMAVGIRRQW